MVWYGRVERPTYIDDFTRHVTQPTRHSTEGQWLASQPGQQPSPRGSAH